MQGLTLSFVLLAKRDSFEQAAILLGAIEADMESTQLSLPPDALEDYSRKVERVRAGMDEEEFKRAQSSGAQMTRDEMIAFAVDVLAGIERVGTT